MTETSILTAAVAGFFLGASLIIAIGAQNAFVLRQGLMRSHVFAVCLVCAVSDAVLIAAGVAGFGALIATRPALTMAATVGGAAFLVAYAGFALRRALRPTALHAEPGAHRLSLGAAITAALAFTWLNPHVYLDTVVLLGGISAGYAEAGRLAFGAGAVTASFVWFFALGYGARLLAPLFARPVAWRVLDALIAVVMLAIAAGLVVRLF